ncbi:MAG: alcohol dehydrogenase catalytic domain-containing protein [Planctomycetota bacterium]
MPGCDGAGFVDALGAGVSGLEPGQRVVLAPGVTAGDDEWTARGEDQLSPTYGILGETRDGTCTDFVVLPARNAIPLADAIDFDGRGVSAGLADGVEHGRATCAARAG